MERGLVIDLEKKELSINGLSRRQGMCPLGHGERFLLLAGCATLQGADLASVNAPLYKGKGGIIFWKKTVMK